MVRLISFFLLILVTVTNSHAQWVEKNNGFYGGAIRSLAVSGTTVFAGTNSGVYRSVDNGETWNKMNAGLTDRIVTSLLIVGSNIFAGTPSGVFLATINGGSWTSVSTGLSISTSVYSMAFSNGNLFAGNADDGIFRTSNSGASWENRFLPSGVKSISSLAASGNYVYAGTYGGGLYMSSNNGDNWNYVSTGILDLTFVYDVMISGTKVFAATDKGIIQSTNNGISWSLVNAEGYSRLLAYNTKIVGLRDNGVFISNDNAVTFSAINSGISSLVISVATNGSSIFAGTAGGVFFTSSDGSTWTVSNTGITSVSLRSIISSGTSLYAATRSGAFKSNDNGSSWTSINTGLPSTYLSDIRLIGTTLFASSVFRGVFRSSDNGASWTNVSEGVGGPLGSTDQLNAMVTSSTTLYVSSRESVHQTSNNGNSWTKGGPGIIDGYYPNLTSVVNMGVTLFAGSNEGVLLSSDDGVNWTLTSLTSDIRSLYVSGTELYALTWSGEIFRSINNGAAWANISISSSSGSAPSNYAHSIVKVGASLFVGTDGNGVYRSADNGATWKALNDGLSNKYINYVTVIGDTFFAGAEDGGLFSRPLSELSDLTPPTINNTTETSVAVGASVTIKATIADAENTITSSIVKYRNLATGSAGIIKEGTLQKNNNEYTYLVPSSDIGVLGLEYQISAVSFGGTNTTGTTFRTVRVNYPDGVTIPYSSFGTDPSNYRIIAVPLELSNDKVSGVFEELMPVDNKKWRLYHYDAVNVRTKQLNSSDEINPGIGYWLIVRDNVNLITSGAGSSVATTSDTPFEIQLKSGSNQIGNPYNYDLTWSDVQDANPGLSVLTVFEGEYEIASTLEKMKGGFVKVNADMKLKFPTKSATGGRVGVDTRPVNNALNSASWEVPLLVRQGDRVNKISGFGMNEKALDGFDRYDGFNMPRFFDRYLELHHARKDGRDIYSNDVVPTANQHEWEFSVLSTLEDPIIQLEWENRYFGDNDLELYLWDVKNSIAIDMRAVNRYAFEKESVSSFKIFYGKLPYIMEKTQVETVVIHPPFPNPSTEEIKISFTLPDHSNNQNVRMSLTDMMGRKYWSYQNSFSSGYQEVMWKRSNEANGIYIISVQSGTSTKQMKVILK